MTGEQLKQARRDAGLTQIEVARKMSSLTGSKISQGNYSRWERGTRKPTAATAALLKMALKA